jgi:hypothetical protein
MSDEPRPTFREVDRLTHGLIHLSPYAVAPGTVYVLPTGTIHDQTTTGLGLDCKGVPAEAEEVMKILGWTWFYDPEEREVVSWMFFFSA